MIGKDNFDEEFRFLLKENPSIAKVIPALVVRDGKNTKKFKILVDYQSKKLVYEDYDFSEKDISDDDIEKSFCYLCPKWNDENIFCKKFSVSAFLWLEVK